jgi:regulator of extracellular matrix RemA (YlzA/DUF370 family)
MSRQDFHVAPDNKTTIVGSSEALRRVITLATQRRSLVDDLYGATRRAIAAARRQPTLTAPSKTTRRRRLRSRMVQAPDFVFLKGNFTDI